MTVESRLQRDDEPNRRDLKKAVHKPTRPTLNELLYSTIATLNSSLPEPESLAIENSRGRSGGRTSGRYTSGSATERKSESVSRIDRRGLVA